MKSVFESTEPGFFPRFLRLAAPFWTGEEAWRARALTITLIALTIAQIIVQVRINLWSAGLFNALEQHSLEGFFVQLEILGLILASGMTVAATHMMVKRRLQLLWRRSMTKRVLDQWVSLGHQVQVTYIPGEHDNPDGRIAEDIRVTTEVAIELAHSLFYCTLLLISFIEILWSLSGVLSFNLGLFTMNIHGHMVWIALGYSSIATTSALMVGWPLIRAADRRQTAEANFRFGLVHVRENAESIALLHGEIDERRRLFYLFSGIRTAWDRQSAAIGRLFLFTSGYSILSTAFPIVVAAPRFIAGTITLGTLMQTAQAFQQLAAALSWPIDNLQRVAEWRASVERVLKLQDALAKLCNGHTPDGAAIAITPDAGPALIFDELTITTPGGAVLLDKFNATIHPGEKVLIAGDPVAAVHLFKVVAGLWPWGKGRMLLPRNASIFFMPHRPYLPVGTLREAVTYPSPRQNFDISQIERALIRVGLSTLIRRMDDRETWENALSVTDQQRLGFARLILHRPDWVFMEEATDALDPEAESAMMTMLAEELPGVTIMTIGYHPGLANLHDRVITPLERRRTHRRDIIPIRQSE